MVTLYTVHADDVPVYLPPDMWDKDYDDGQVTPIVSKLAMEDNKSGTFEFTVLPSNLAYDEIELICTTIKVTEYVYEDDGTLHSKQILWKGRAISVEDDMSQNRTFTCEGALAFLNDIICYPISNRITSDVITPYSGVTSIRAMKNQALKEALQDYLDDGGNNNQNVGDDGSLFKQSGISTVEFKDCIYTVGRGYNAICPSGREFTVGEVTIANASGTVGFVDGTEPENEWYPSDDYPNGVWSFQGELASPTAAFATALDQILDITVNLNGGHLRVRHVEKNGKERMYLDYLGDYEDGDSSAEYGVNVIEFSGRLELNAPVTDIIPRGAVVSTWNGNETTDDAIDTDQFQAGDQVRFIGSRHYVASTSDIGYRATPGYARITNLNFKGQHPIHLVHTDDTSNVYGWVNQADVEPYNRYNTKKDIEFVQRKYESYPYTEYVGIKDQGDGVHVINSSLARKYGHIQQIVDFPDISAPDELLAAAEEWLETHSSFLKQTYEVSLVDLGHVYGTGETPIHLLDRVHVSMPNHGIDEYMPVTKIEIDLLNPADTTVSFSKERTGARFALMSLRSRAAAVSDPAVELNQPGDSISQSMARNIKYIADTSAHAAINTSTTQNMKVTLPEGETTTVDIKEENGTSNTLIFVNGLLSANGKKGAAPKYDIFSYNWKYIVGKGIRPPAVSSAWVIEDHVSSNLPVTSKYPYILFDSDENLSEGSRDRWYFEKNFMAEGGPRVYALPMCCTSSPDEVPELTLDDTYGSLGYGLYYRMENDVRKYWASPCIYYLPSGYSGLLYIFCAIPCPKTEPFYSEAGKHTALAGQMICKFVYDAAFDNTTKSVFKSMFNDIIAPEMENDLRCQYRKNKPTYTATDSGLFKVQGGDYKRPPCTATLITPFQSLARYITEAPDSGLFTAGVYAENVIIRESKSYTYINGSPRPRTIKIYNHRISTEYGPGKVLPSASLTATDNGIVLTIPDRMRFGGDIKTTITTPKYYIFANEDDWNACFEDYISSGLSQSAIESKYRSKIVSVNNGSASSTNPECSQMQVAYRYNGVATKFYTAGSPYGDP